MSVYTRVTIGALIMLFFTVILLVVIPAYVEKPRFIPGFAPGPSMWPKTVATLGAFTGLLFVLLQAPDWIRRVPSKKNWFVETRIYWIRSVVSVIALAIYLMLIPVIGIVPASSLLLAILYVLMGQRQPLLWMIGLTAVFPFGLYWLFTSITSTLFPMGSLWKSLGS